MSALTGHLRGVGITVDPWDLNVAFYRRIFTPGYLDYSLARAQNTHEFLQARLTLGRVSGDRSHEMGRLATRYFEIEKYLTTHREVWEQTSREIAEAVCVFDDRERFYDPVQLVRAWVTLDKALELVSLPHHPSRLRFNDFSAPGLPLTVDGLIRFTEDSAENPFLAFLTSQVRPLLRGEPRLIGVSINSHSQLFGGLTLARLLRRHKTPHTHVTLGGNYFMRVRQTLLDRPVFLETFADSVMMGEGEASMADLFHALEDGRPLETVPNLVFSDEKAVPRFTFSQPPIPLAERGLPDLDGLPLQDYFCPETVLVTRASKGCSWQKCTFCDADYGIQPDVRPVERVLEEVEHVRSRWGIENFEFIDESMNPVWLEEFSRRLQERGDAIHFFGNGRTEKAFTFERMEQMARAGLTMILWGIESGNKRIMDLIQKGVDFHTRLDILRAARQAGLWNFAFIFFGFPSETEEEALQTIRLIRDNRDIINAYGRSVFTLGKHSRIRGSARRLGLVDVIEDDQEFATTLSYRVTSGMSREKALEMADRCRLECAEAFGVPLWMLLRHREVIHLYLKEKGRDFMEGYRFPPEEYQRLEELFQPTSPEELSYGVLSTADSP
jgi:anaerobic magnesium-protoporphyrin IX monomethyl ester cyclase